MLRCHLGALRWVPQQSISNYITSQLKEQMGMGHPVFGTLATAYWYTARAERWIWLSPSRKLGSSWKVVGVEHPRRQPLQGMHVALVQQLAPLRLASPTLKERVVRHDHGRPSVDSQPWVLL
jgi:hypothetical protein